MQIAIIKWQKTLIHLPFHFFIDPKNDLHFKLWVIFTNPIL